MPEYTKPRPALILLEAYEKIIGWVYLPLFFLVLPTVLGIAARRSGLDGSSAQTFLGSP